MNRFIAAVFAAFLFVGAAHASDDGYYVNLNLGSTVLPEDGHDNSTVYGIGVGRSFSDTMRLELGFERQDNGNHNAFTSEVDALLGTVYHDMDYYTFGSVTPFVGLSAGYGWADGTDFAGTDDDGLLWGPVFGFNVELNDSVDFVTQYRFLSSPDMDTVDRDGGVNEYDTHAVTAGIRFNF